MDDHADRDRDVQRAMHKGDPLVDVLRSLLQLLPVAGSELLHDDPEVRNRGARLVGGSPCREGSSLTTLREGGGGAWCKDFCAVASSPRVNGGVIAHCEGLRPSSSVVIHVDETGRCTALSVKPLRYSASASAIADMTSAGLSHSLGCLVRQVWVGSTAGAAFPHGSTSNCSRASGADCGNGTVP